MGGVDGWTSTAALQRRTPLPDIRVASETPLTSWGNILVFLSEYFTKNTIPENHHILLFFLTQPVRVNGILIAGKLLSIE